MAIQNDNTLVTKGDLKALYGDKIAPYLGANLAIRTNNDDFYSTDEKIVGVWSDGKPLYQKLIIDTMPKVTTAGTYVTKNVILNIDNIDLIFLKFSFVIDPNSITRPMPYTLNSGYQSKASAAKTYLQVASAITEHSQRPFYAVIQYTKTTDTASTSLTAGAYDINFPNTWPEKKEIFFGNGLYGWKGSLDNVTIANNAEWISTTDFSSGVTSICNEGGTFVNNTDNYSIHTGLHSQSIGKFIDSGFFIDTNSKLKAYVTNTCGKSIVWSLKNAWVTYTK